MNEEIIGRVCKCEDTSRYGCYYDVSNEYDDLTHLLERYHDKTVKVTIELIKDCIYEKVCLHFC